MWPIAAALVGSQIINGIMQKKGVKAQTRMLRRANQNTEAWRKDIMDLYQTLVAEGKPLRDAYNKMAQEELPKILEDINAPIGESLAYKDALETGTRDISSQMAKYGLLKSRATGEAVGRLGAGLLAREQEDKANRRMSLLELPKDTLQPALSLLGTAGSATGEINQNLINQGAVKAGLYDTIGQNVAQLPLSYMLAGGNMGGSSKPVIPSNNSGLIPDTTRYQLDPNLVARSNRGSRLLQ